MRLNESGDGIACGYWERFVVSLCDLTRDDDEISARKAQTLTLFLAAVASEQGEEMAKLARSHLANGTEQMPLGLKVQVFKSTHKLLTQTAPSDRLRHEPAIPRATGGAQNTEASSGNTATPEFEKIVARDFEQIVAQAIKTVKRPDNASDLLTENEFELLVQKYARTGKESDLGPHSGNRLTLFRAIEESLKKRWQADAKDRVRHQDLSAILIQRLGLNAVKEVITREINEIGYFRYNTNSPFAAAMIAAIEDSKLGPRARELITSERMLHALETIDAREIADNKHPLSRLTCDQLRQKTIKRAISNAQVLTWLAYFDIPDGPALTPIVKTCLLLPSRTGEAYFGALKDTLTGLSRFAASELPPSPENQNEAVQALCANLMKHLPSDVTSADDLANFAALSVDLFAASASRETLANLKRWMGCSALTELRAEIEATISGTIATAPDQVAMTNLMNYVIFSLDAIQIPPVG